MPLTKAEIESIIEVIDSHSLALTYEALGPRVLTEEELTKLKARGLIRDSVRHLTADPAALGQLIALIPSSRAMRLTYDQVLQATKKLTKTAVEKEAINYASDHAGEYIRGLRDRMVRDSRSEIIRRGMSAQRAVQEGVKQAISDRKTISELKTTLFSILDDRERDWHRVAHTEMNTALQHGTYREIRSASDEGEDQLVYKLPNPDACPHCKRLYLEADGMTPKKFRLKDLADSNFGRRAADWQPTIGSVHPYCACTLLVIPEGYDFEKMNTAKEKFEFEDNTYNVGEIIPDETYSRFSSEEKDKTKNTAILTFKESEDE